MKDHIIESKVNKSANANSALIESAVEFVKEKMAGNDPSHDWYHVERVWRNAVHLAKEEEKRGQLVDMEVVELAALFHDIVDFKYESTSSTAQSGQKLDLDQITRDRLNEFFAKHNYSSEKAERIIYVVCNISWRKELEMKASGQSALPVELQVVRDADRLEAIGAVGMARCFAYSGAKYRPLYVPDLAPIANMSAEQYNKQTLENKSTAINHFHEKLLLIKDKMQTETGKSMANQRHDYMLAFLKQFELEIL